MLCLRGRKLIGVLEVYEATEVHDQLIEGLIRLVPQLSTSALLPDRGVLQEIVSSQACLLLVAVDDNVVVGTLTLALFRIPTGLRAWIEDVVVDESVRGRGVGEALNREAVDRARAAGATTVDLTSRPEREAANRLYSRLGFQQRDTNVYRLSL